MKLIQISHFSATENEEHISRNRMHLSQKFTLDVKELAFQYVLLAYSHCVW